MYGFDFDRQRPIDNYIVDFYCKDLMLAIEIDGITHDSVSSQTHDLKRQKRLEDLGVQFLRFLDDEVRNNLEGVYSVINEWIKKHSDEFPGQFDPDCKEEILR
jgi:very-short-patch-repair endonuclease